MPQKDVKTWEEGYFHAAHLSPPKTAFHQNLH